MGLLGNLLKKFRPLEVEDEFFGHLVYMKMPKGRTSYWEAKRAFPPTGRDIELFIDAPGPEQAPSELQCQFFSNVASDYHKILAAVAAVLRPQFAHWTRRPLSLSFGSECTLTGFSIPNAPFEHAHWDMSFESHTDANPLFTVALRGGTATGVSIDG